MKRGWRCVGVYFLALHARGVVIFTRLKPQSAPIMNITEIAPDVFRLSLYVPELNLQFNHFLVRDDEPLLYHTGMRKMFP